jgi:hypothetical protein
VRRFDTRFFTADASAITHHVEGVIHAEAELVELVWVGSKTARRPASHDRKSSTNWKSASPLTAEA